MQNSVDKDIFIYRWTIGDIQGFKIPLGVRGEGCVGESLPHKLKELDLNSPKIHKARHDSICL